MTHAPGNAIHKTSKRDRAVAELVLALRFGLVGSVATGIHVLVLWLVLANGWLAPLEANAVAFAVAFAFSFAGNYLWTFGPTGNPRRAMLRFLLISAGAFLLNSALLATILWLDRVPPTVAALASAAVVPLFTFVGSRFWGFKREARI